MRIAAYCRVSTDEQASRRTIDAQIRETKQYSLQHFGTEPTMYIDDGVSGMLFLHERPAGRTLLDDAKLGLIDTIIVYDLDRLGRGNDLRMTTNIVLDLRDQGIRVISTSQGYDSFEESTAGDLTLGIHAWAATAEPNSSRVEKIVAMCSAFYRCAARRPRYTGGPHCELPSVPGDPLERALWTLCVHYANNIVEALTFSHSEAPGARRRHHCASN